MLEPCETLKLIGCCRSCIRMACQLGSANEEQASCVGPFGRVTLGHFGALNVINELQPVVAVVVGRLIFRMGVRPSAPKTAELTD